MIDRSDLHILTMISNPARYRSRIRLYRKFVHDMHHLGVKLWTVEVALGERPFTVTCPDFPRHLQLRTNSIMWHKENALELLLRHLTMREPDWKYVGWFDADIEFPHAYRRGESTLSHEIVHKLQEHMVIQPWSHVVDLGPEGEHLASHESFASAYSQGKKRGKCYTFWHPGYAWCARREFIEKVGLMTFPPLGAADHHMALSMIGAGGESMPGGISPGYKKAVLTWEERCERVLRRDLGVVHGTILHGYHGAKKNRRYVERWEILTKNAFDPVTDLSYDAQGLYRLVDHGGLRSVNLRREIQAYFWARLEDSLEE